MEILNSITRFLFAPGITVTVNEQVILVIPSIAIYAALGYFLWKEVLK